jgi:hypothetical protein
MDWLMAEVQQKPQEVKAKSMAAFHLSHGGEVLGLQGRRVLCLYRGPINHATLALHFRSAAAGFACLQFDGSHAQSAARRVVAVF